MCCYFGDRAHGSDSTSAHLARSIAGVQKAGLDLHDMSLASESTDVSLFEVFPADAYCSGTGKRISRIRSVARTVSSRRRIGGRATELVIDHEYFWGSAVAVLRQFLTEASSSRGRLFDCRRASVNYAHGAENMWRNPVSSPQVVFIGLTSASNGCIGNGLRVRGSPRLSRAGFGGRSVLRADKVQR